MSRINIAEKPFCIPITPNNPSKVFFSNNKYLIVEMKIYLTGQYVTVQELGLQPFPDLRHLK